MGKSALPLRARKHGLLGVGTVLLLTVPNEAQQSPSRHGLLTASGPPFSPPPSIFRVLHLHLTFSCSHLVSARASYLRVHA